MISKDIASLIEAQIKSEVEIQLSTLIDSIKTDLLADIYLTRLELKNYLKFKSISSVDNLVKEGLKKYKVGKKTLFLRSDVDSFVLGR